MLNALIWYEIECYTDCLQGAVGRSGLDSMMCLTCIMLSIMLSYHLIIFTEIHWQILLQTSYKQIQHQGKVSIVLIL